MSNTTKPALPEPDFYGFLHDEDCRVELCYSPSSPRGDGVYATPYYSANKVYAAIDAAVAEWKSIARVQSAKLAAALGEPEADKRLQEVMRSADWKADVAEAAPPARVARESALLLELCHASDSLFRDTDEHRPEFARFDAAHTAAMDWLAGVTPAPARVALSVTDDMVSRFLSWPLPRDFYPDCGISFDGRKDDEWNKNKTWPIGTNLLTAIQARHMLEHVLGVAHGDME